MSTMNEQDDETKHAYDRYQLEVLQGEWERAEAQQKLFYEGLVETVGDNANAWRACQEVQHVVPEHTPAIATVAANAGLTGGGQGVKPPFADVDEAEDHDEDLEHDEWLDELWSAEELERAECEAGEVRDDH